MGFSRPLIISEGQIEDMLGRFAQALDETADWVADEGLASVV